MRYLKEAEVEKKLALATTVEACFEILKVAPPGFGPGSKVAAFNKALQVAKTLDEWEKCLEVARPRSDDAHTCIRAIAKLLDEKK